MAKTILFIHSAGPQGRHEGSSGFVALLKRSLGAGYPIKFPKMPHPERPDYEPWKVRVGKELAKVEDGSILVGHSLGGSVLLKYLSEEPWDKNFSGLFLVATPFWGLKGWEYDAFYLKKGFAKKLDRVGRIFIYHTRDDQEVTKDHPARYAESLPDATVRMVEGYGHTFDAKECPELIRDLKTLKPGKR